MSGDIFTNSEAQSLYEDVFKWLTLHSVGERRLISSYKSYSNTLFIPLINKFNCISKRENLTKQEKQFINCIFYIGRIFRIHTYSESSRKYVCLTNYYSHWSQDIDGIRKVKNYGTWLLLIGETTIDNPGIHIFNLLNFLFTYNKIQPVNSLQDSKRLLRYKSENEIAATLSTDILKDLRVIDIKDIHNWRITGREIDKSKWYRKTLP